MIGRIQLPPAGNTSSEGGPAASTEGFDKKKEEIKAESATPQPAVNAQGTSRDTSPRAGSGQPAPAVLRGPAATNAPPLILAQANTASKTTPSSAGNAAPKPATPQSAPPKGPAQVIPFPKQGGGVPTEVRPTMQGAPKGAPSAGLARLSGLIGVAIAGWEIGEELGRRSLGQDGLTAKGIGDRVGGQVSAWSRQGVEIGTHLGFPKHTGAQGHIDYANGLLSLKAGKPVDFRAMEPNAVADLIEAPWPDAATIRQNSQRLKEAAAPSGEPVMANPTPTPAQQTLPDIGTAPHQRRLLTQTCSNADLDRLQSEKDSVCNSIPGKSCSPSKISQKKLNNYPCSDIRARITALQACRDKRDEIQTKCFGGVPDAGHKQALDGIDNGINQCRALEHINCAPGHPMADQ